MNWRTRYYRPKAMNCALKYQNCDGKASVCADISLRNGMCSLVAENRGEIDLGTAKSIQSSHFDSTDGAVRPGMNCPCTHYEYEGRHAGTVSAVALEICGTETIAHVSLGNPCEGRWIEHVLPHHGG